MAYGVLINNSAGNSLVDTRTDKQTTVIKSGTVACPARTTTVVSGKKYCIVLVGGGANFTSFGAPNNNQDTIYTATSSGTINSGSDHAEIGILTGCTGVTSTNQNETGLVVFDGGSGTGGIEAYRVHHPDNSVVSNGTYGISNKFTTSSGTVNYKVAAVRF